MFLSTRTRSSLYYIIFISLSTETSWWWRWSGGLSEFFFKQSVLQRKWVRSDVIKSQTFPLNLPSWSECGVVMLEHWEMPGHIPSLHLFQATRGHPPLSSQWRCGPPPYGKVARQHWNTLCVLNSPSVWGGILHLWPSLLISLLHVRLVTILWTGWLLRINCLRRCPDRDIMKEEVVFCNEKEKPWGFHSATP